MRNVNLPKTQVFVRCDAFGGPASEFESAWLVSARALRNRPFCFQVWVDRFAACYDKIPPHCLYWYRPEPGQFSWPLHKIQLWECLSGSIELWQKNSLVDVPMVVNMGGGQRETGHYWFTLDFLPDNQGQGYLDVGDTELLQEHKEANVIKISTGQIAIYPNNRLKWLPISLTSEEAVKAIPDWQVATNEQWDEWWQDSGELLGKAQWAY